MQHNYLTLMPAQMTKNDKTDDEHTNKHINLEEYPSYPHTSGRMGAMAIYCPIGVGVVVVVVVVWVLV